ncbi:WD40/YVTN/BNR-like repeat-containing protein [Burkholderia sp. PU8-34]
MMFTVMHRIRRISNALGIAMVLNCIAATSALAAWVEQGPGPILNGQAEGLLNNPVSGGVNTIVPDPVNANVAYVGTVNGGVWKTITETAATPIWIPLTDHKLPALSISSLAVSPLTSSTLFAGTGSTSSDGFDGSPGFGVARTTDGGNTWSIEAGTTFAGRRITSIVPTSITSGGLDGQVVLAATLFDGGGVYRSTNGGKSFTRISGGTAGLPNAGVSSLVADPTDPYRFYAAVPQQFGGGAAAGVYRSNDGGATWVPVDSGLSALGTSARILLAVGRGTGVVYAMVINSTGTLSGVFRSATDGANWTPMGVPSPSIFPGAQGDVHGAIVADPRNPNVVFISGDRQALPSANGCINFSGNTFRGDASLGSPWQNVVCNGAHGTSPHADSRGMAFDASGNLLQVNDGGIYSLITPNAASRQWQSVNGNLRPTELHSAAYDSVSKVIFGGAQDTGTPMQNSPGNFTWTDFLQGDGGVVAVDTSPTHAGTSIRYTSFFNLGLFNRSTWSASNTLLGGSVTPLGLLIVAGAGAGKTLYQFDPNIQFYNPYVLNRIDPSRMLIGTATIYESLNKGDSLNNLGFTGKFITSLSYGGRLGTVAKPDVFYVGTRGAAGPYIWHRTTLGGPVTTLNTYPGSSVRSLVSDPRDFRSVYVVDDQSRVWASFDEGSSWSNLTANLNALLQDARTIEIFSSDDPSITQKVLIVGGLGGVFQLPGAGTPGGSKWSRLSRKLPHGLVLDLHYDYTDNVLVAGILGRGAWTLKRFFHGDDTESEPATDKPDPMELHEDLPKVEPRVHREHD